MPIQQEKQIAIILETLYSSGNWYRLPLWVFNIKVPQLRGERTVKAILKPTVALILASLLDQASYQKAAEMSNGWFEYNARKGERQTGCSRKVQNDHIETLVESGLICKKREKKIHGRRLIKFNYTMLCEVLLEANSSYDEFGKETLDTNSLSNESLQEEGGSCNDSLLNDVTDRDKTITNTQNSEQTKKQTTAGQAGRGSQSNSNPHSKPVPDKDRKAKSRTDGTPPRQGTLESSPPLEESEPAVEFNRRFQTVILTKIKPPFGIKGAKTGVSNFTVLLQSRSVTEVDQVLTFFEKQWSWEYCPEILTAKTFVDKFTSLERSMKRFHQQNPEKKVESDTDNEMIYDGRDRVIIDYTVRDGSVSFSGLPNPFLPKELKDEVNRRESLDSRIPNVSPEIDRETYCNLSPECASAWRDRMEKRLKYLKEEQERGEDPADALERQFRDRILNSKKKPNQKRD